MKNNEVNIALYKLLSDWNPMNFDDQSLGDSEVYECMDAVHEIEDVNELAQKFQDIYVFSFDITINKEICMQMAIKATALQSYCEI
ncbi:DUF1871 family protein [Mammaliicoccus stepanovicii]|uniref:Domain of uncharacterized function (DUF1871) n=1 Tax=Mammaliicoccus stepanovicii TaxID=643214 RepID=A0A239ZTA2_9STAP|nr:DUF1871 family protein [Mammaliicoccus stepanovicii]PNZ77510.1 DUF1871 domain-containing protein [Mammaliicoccus stepanovicii]GGI38919.1 hypothetical protein GCM10010896_00790 [Mammaliicoccus stepanovicii]SNV74441.1 Domain of uncharacterised function (DUF1871) [Mammaliicoccus stepanovicii]